MTLSSKGKIGIIGSGVMGQAFIGGILKSKLVPASRLWAAEKREDSCKKIEQQTGVHTIVDYHDELKKTDVVLICVKPNQVDEVIQNLCAMNIKEDTLVISIAAGTALSKIENALGSKNPVIRAMPNTPVVVGQGMTVISPGKFARPGDLKTAKKIFESVGKCIELEEKHLDAVTGLGGSGPAYLYLIMEALADGGVKVGLPRDVALEIVSQTVLGAATMVQKAGRHPAALKDDVTTPAGTTIAALMILEDGKIRSVLARAVEEASTRASKLGSPKKQD